MPDSRRVVSIFDDLKLIMFSLQSNRIVTESDTIRVGDYSMHVLLTLGHAPGHVSRDLAIIRTLQAGPKTFEELNRVLFDKFAVQFFPGISILESHLQKFMNEKSKKMEVCKDGGTLYRGQLEKADTGNGNR